jgi:hypothetical protein
MIERLSIEAEKAHREAMKKIGSREAERGNRWLLVLVVCWLSLGALAVVLIGGLQ